MGAWGAGSFENDYAMDWTAGLVEAADASALVEAFDAMPAPGEFLDSPEASMALAAAEVVAAAMGAQGPNLPAEVIDWVRVHQSEVTPGLAKRAQDAAARIVADSDLRQLWEESDSFAEWQKVVLDLLRRLGAPA